MIYHDVPQGADDWFDLRRGVPTASRFDRILTPKTLKPSGSQQGLIAELIGERLSAIPPEGVENYTNRAIRWGLHCEDEARHWYAMERGVQLRNGGFCLTDDGRFGASPDGLIGEEGCLELKCPQANVQAGYLLEGVVPDEYKCQVHGHLIVTGYKWCDFMSYCPGDWKPLLIRVFPDDFTRELRIGLEVFWGRYAKAIEKIKSL
jgi:putative phage-type endonuclease